MQQVGDGGADRTVGTAVFGWLGHRDAQPIAGGVLDAGTAGAGVDLHRNGNAAAESAPEHGSEHQRLPGSVGDRRVDFEQERQDNDLDQDDDDPGADVDTA